MPQATRGAGRELPGERRKTVDRIAGFTGLQDYNLFPSGEVIPPCRFNQ
jgi:hypothetical protein